VGGIAIPHSRGGTSMVVQRGITKGKENQLKGQPSVPALNLLRSGVGGLGEKKETGCWGGGVLGFQKRPPEHTDREGGRNRRKGNMGEEHQEECGNPRGSRQTSKRTMKHRRQKEEKKQTSKRGPRDGERQSTGEKVGYRQRRKRTKGK